LWREVHGNQEQIDLVDRVERRDREEQEKDGGKREGKKMGKRWNRLGLQKEKRGNRIKEEEGRSRRR
jgi:hypothetical protein